MMPEFQLLQLSSATCIVGKRLPFTLQAYRYFMKTKFAFALAASIILSSALPGASNAQGAPTDTSAPGNASMPQSAPELGGRGRGRFGGGQDMDEMREKRHQRMLQHFDANHDGTLDDSERAKMRAAREEKMKQMGLNGGGTGSRGMGGADGAPGMGGPQGRAMSGRMGGRGGMGGMSDEQRQARRQMMKERFDSNHDGKIDESERSQMREALGKMGGGHHRRRGGGNPGGPQSGGMPGGSAGNFAGGGPGSFPPGAPGNMPGGAPDGQAGTQ